MRVSDPAVLAEFDAVVVATGVMPRQLELEGVELAHVRSYAELLLDEDEVGAGSVAIIGAGGIGVDVAHMLSHAGRDDPRGEFYARYGLEGEAGPAPTGEKVTPSVTFSPAGAGERAITVMRRKGRVGDGVGPSTRWVVVQELEQVGVELLTDVQYERIEPGAVVITDADGERRRVPADRVIIAAGQEPQTELLLALQAAGRPCVAIGGAAGAERLDAGRAFREGFEAPRAVALALAGEAFRS
jgi:2,4-dienoyl-CoA reductase (NADPH2)